MEQILNNEIYSRFKLKEELIGPPDIYLGGKMREVMLELENEIKPWPFSSLQ